jgi:hypothetical protein
VPDGETKWVRAQDAWIKELVGNSHESRRVEETSEEGQDSLRVVMLLLLMMRRRRIYKQCPKNIRTC